MMSKRFYYLLLGLACLIGGCTQTHHTAPPRAATELYLLSVATDHAIAPVRGGELRGRRIWVDSTYASEKDHQYLVASLRAKLLRDGARIAEKRDDAEIIVEVRTPGVSIDRSEFLIGIPGLPIGAAAAAVGLPPTPVNTPELAIIKNLKQWGTAGVAYVAYWRATGEIVASSGPHIGRSYREDWSFFGATSTLSDIPPAKPPEQFDLPEEGNAANDAATDAQAKPGDDAKAPSSPEPEPDAKLNAAPKATE